MTAIALTVLTDPEHGGRWTSLTGGGREWLWRRDEPRRHCATAGDEFADAGGLEECIPTVSGYPDHGEVWARRWRAHGRTAVVATDGFELARTLTQSAGAIVAEYRLAAEPGFGFLWAAHALLDVSERARLLISEGTGTTVFDDARPIASGPWPAPAGTRLDLLGPSDGTATAAVTATGAVAVADGPDRLHLLLEAEGVPVSTALWRNLGGWPSARPYRSIGVEPMLGRAFDLAKAGPDDRARVPAAGELRWRLTVRATRQL